MLENSKLETTAESPAAIAELDIFKGESAEGAYSGFALSPVSEFGDSFVYWFDDMSDDPQDIENFRFVDALSSETQPVIQSLDPDYYIGLSAGDDVAPLEESDIFNDYLDDHAFSNAAPGATIEWGGGETAQQGFEPQTGAENVFLSEAQVNTALTDAGLLA